MVSPGGYVYRNHYIVYRVPDAPEIARWQWHHEGYDGATDSGDVRCGYARTEERAKADIDDLIETQEGEENHEGGEDSDRAGECSEV